MKQKNILTFLALLLVTTLLFAFTYRTWQYNYLKYPLTYSHDGIETLKQIKHLSTGNNHFADNNSLGVPFTSNLYENFPTADELSILIIKALSLITTNHFLVFNLYVYLSYLLVASTAFFVLRHLKIQHYLAFCAALLFAFLPYHQIRTIVGHVFLINYATIPLSALFAIKILQKKKDFFVSKKLGQNIFLLLTLIAIGSIGTAYYTAFSLIVWGVSATIVFFQDKQHRWQWFSILLSLSLLSLTIVLVNILPSLIATQAGKANLNIINRNPQQIEEFGLRLNRLLFPLPSRAMPFLNTVLTKYYQGTQHELWQFMGWPAVLGFYLIFANLFLKTKNQLNKNLAWLITAIILITSTGGLALIFGTLISSSIRSYGRISIFIAFFSLYGLASYWQNLWQKKKLSLSIVFLALLMFALSLFDQISVINPHLNAWNNQAMFDEDQELMQRVAQDLPSGTKIFQLPLVEYPEAPGQCQFDSYDLFKPYLHSDQFSWSFGIVSGTQNASWYESLSELSLDELLIEISEKGFDAIYIDTRSCGDPWAIESKLAEITQGQLHTSQDFHSLVLDFSDYAENVKMNNAQKIH